MTDERPHAPDCFCYKCEAEQFSVALAAKDEADERLARTACSPPCCASSELSPLQRSHNYLTYQMGVIAHRLDHGDSPESVSVFALEARDYAESILHNIVDEIIKDFVREKIEDLEKEYKESLTQESEPL